MARWFYPLLVLIVSTAAACSQDDLQAVSIPECDDLNICTTDHWDQELFECVFEAVDDGTTCPAPDTCAITGICQVGACVPDEVVVCEDEDAA